MFSICNIWKNGVQFHSLISNNMKYLLVPPALVSFQILQILFWKIYWKIFPSLSSHCMWFYRPLLYSCSVICFPGWEIPCFDPCSISLYSCSVLIFLRWETKTAHSIQVKSTQWIYTVTLLCSVLFCMSFWTIPYIFICFFWAAKEH